VVTILSVRSILPALLLAALGAVMPAAAQSASPAPLSRAGEGFALETLGHRLTMPAPEWLVPAGADADPVAAVEALFAADGRQALLEILPKGEDPVEWTTLYAARIMLEPERDLADYRQVVMLGYAQTCQRSLTAFFQLGQDEGDNLAPLGFVCGAHLDWLDGFAGRGQVAIVSFKRTERGIAAVYQEWRGRAFDPTNPSTWPVATDVVERQAQALQRDAALLVSGD
jgi:hypothetical protein